MRMQYKHWNDRFCDIILLFFFNSFFGLLLYKALLSRWDQQSVLWKETYRKRRTCSQVTVIMIIITLLHIIILYFCLLRWTCHLARGRYEGHKVLAILRYYRNKLAQNPPIKHPLLKRKSNEKMKMLVRKNVFKSIL